MKHLTFLLFFVFLSLFSYAQSIHLEVGDKFEYQFTNYSTTLDANNSIQTKELESYTLVSYKFNVTQKEKSGYKIECFQATTDTYSRVRKDKNSLWETSSNKHNELYNEQTSFEKNLDTHFTLHLNKDGNISDVKIKDYASRINKMNRKFLPSKKSIEEQFKKFLDSYFFNIPNNIKIGETITLKGNKYALERNENGLLTFSNKYDKDIDYSNTTTHYPQKTKTTNRFTGKSSGPEKIIIDKNTGLVKEKIYNRTQNLIINENPNNTRTTKITHRGVCLAESRNGYKCLFIDDGKQDSTTLFNTNVRIRGRIIHPDQDRRVVLSWGESLPSAYKKMGIITTLYDDNTFEIRLHLDQIKYIDFSHKERSSFYLMPGDDVYLTVDLNAFDETIHTTGVGAPHINLCLKNYLYDEQHQTDGSTLYNSYQEKTISATPVEMKRYLLSTLSGKQTFLLKNANQVAPEVYQALYWDNQCKIAKYLKKYSEDQKRRRPQQGLEPFNTNSLTYTNLDSLIHPDNDLMAFSSEYDNFIRGYTYFYIKDKIRQISGVGNTVFRSDFYDNIYNNNYALANTFFTGKTQESLKYSTVVDALENASFETFENLYLQYKSDYPHSSRIKILDNAYYTSKKTAPLSPAYNFTINDLEGNQHQLSDYKGKAVYLRFWNLGCGTDGSFEESYNTLQDSLKDQNIVYITIFSNGSIDKAKKYISKYNLKSTFLLASRQEQALLKNEYFFNRASQYYLIDINGNIVTSKHIEPQELLWDLEQLEDAFNPPLNSINYQQRSRLMTIISLGLLSLLVLTGIIMIWIKIRNNKRLQLASLNQQLRESELKAIRAQMNPHFLHNCLNAIQNLIQKQELEKAHQYISKFAQLIRDTLTNSDKEDISLAQELEMISNYVALEQLRFDIDFQIDIADEIDIYAIFIPPMLLQPIVENAIIHGLASKEDDKQLKLAIYQQKDFIHIEIIDNGIGRKASQELTKDTTGKGTSFTKERLTLIQKKYGTIYQMNILDQHNAQQEAIGTKVEIIVEDEE